MFCQSCGAPVKSANGQNGVQPAGHLSAAGGDNAVAQAQARVLIRRLPPEDQPYTLPSEEREIALDGRNVAVGRSPSCDIVLDGDQLVSRRHALMRFDGQHFTIVDLGSSNGTYVNDVEIRDLTPLADGDRIKVGEHELAFSTAPASASASFAGVRPGPVGTPAPATASAVALPVAPAAQNGASSDAARIAPPAEPVRATTSGELDLSATAEVPAVGTDSPAVVISPSLADTTQDEGLPASEADVLETPYGERTPPRDLSENRTLGAGDDAPDDAQAAFPTNDPLPVSEAAVAPEAALSPAVAAASASASLPGNVSASHPRAGRHSSSEVQALSEQLRQLAEASAVIAERAEYEARLAEERGTVVAEMRDRLQAILAAAPFGTPVEQSAPAVAATGTSLDELITITRQAAENPRHLDYLARLGEHAGQIADLLERSQQQSAPDTLPEQTRTALDQLVEWLDRQS